MKSTTSPACSSSEADSGPVKLSECGFAASAAMSLLNLRALCERLGDDADILYAGLSQGGHYGGPTAEGNGFVAADVHRLMRGVFHLRKQLRAEFVDVHRFVIQIDALGFVNGNDHAHLGEFFHGLRLGDVHFDSGLQYRRGDHENDQQYKDDV